MITLLFDPCAKGNIKILMDERGNVRTNWEGIPVKFNVELTSGPDDSTGTTNYVSGAIARGATLVGTFNTVPKSINETELGPVLVHPQTPERPHTHQTYEPAAA